MIRIFRKKPQEGRPISTIGFAEGLHKMAYAWENLTMRGGHIEWSCWGAPTIVVDPAAIRDLMLEGGLTSPSGLPDGTEIWGRVEYYTGGTSPVLRQYKDVWSSATQTFTESETATTIATIGSHEEAHGIT